MSEVSTHGGAPVSCSKNRLSISKISRFSSGIKFSFSGVVEEKVRGIATSEEWYWEHKMRGGRASSGNHRGGTQGVSDEIKKSIERDRNTHMYL